MSNQPIPKEETVTESDIEEVFQCSSILSNSGHNRQEFRVDEFGMGEQISVEFGQDPGDGQDYVLLTLKKDETGSEVTFSFEKEEAKLMAEYFETLAERI